MKTVYYLLLLCVIGCIVYFSGGQSLEQPVVVEQPAVIPTAVVVPTAVPCEEVAAKEFEATRRENAARAGYEPYSEEGAAFTSFYCSELRQNGNDAEAASNSAIAAFQIVRENCGEDDICYRADLAALTRMVEEIGLAQALREYIDAKATEPPVVTPIVAPTPTPVIKDYIPPDDWRA